MSTPPPFYKAFEDSTKLVGVFNTLKEAQSALEDILEDYHESIAFDSDHYHESLENLFWATAKIIKVG